MDWETRLKLIKKGAGFTFNTSEDTERLRGYQVLAHSGLRGDVYRLPQPKLPIEHWKMQEFSKGHDLQADRFGTGIELVYSSPMFTSEFAGNEQRVVGHKGLFRKPVYVDFPIMKERPLKAREVLESNNEEDLYGIAYFTIRAMPDSGGRNGTQVTNTAYMGKNDHDELVSAIRQKPNITREFFEDVFPELNRKYLEGTEFLGDVIYLPQEVSS